MAAELGTAKPPPLGRDIPAAIRSPLDAGLARYADDRTRLAAARERIATLEKVRTWNTDVIAGGLYDGSKPFVTMLEAILLLEPMALGEGPLAEEARADVFAIYDLAALVGRIGTGSIAAARGTQAWFRAQGQTVDLPSGFLDDFLAVLLYRGEALHRAIGARILRAGKPAAAVAHVLRFLASDKESTEAYEAALPLREEELRAAGADATAIDWARLASAYARTQDLARSRVAVARARARLAQERASDRYDDSAREVAAAEANVGFAETLERLANATSQDERLERARAASDLRLTARARAELEAIRTEWPNDARARTGLALVMLRASAALPDVVTLQAVAHELDAPDLKHTDGAYYELAAGLFGVRMLTELAPTAGNERQVVAGIDASFVRLAELAKGLAPYNPSRAAALQYLADVVREAMGSGKEGWEARLHRCPAETHAMRARFPQSLDVAKLAVAASEFSDDASAAFAEIEAPLPASAAEDPPFLLDRAIAELGLVARFGGAERLAGARAIVEETARGKVSRADVALLEGDLASLTALVAPREGGWQLAVDAYERALASVEGAKRARALSNQGFAVLQLGDVDGAQRRWTDAVAADKSASLASCNAALQLATTDAGRKLARERLTSFAHQGGQPCTYGARASLVALARAAHAPRARVAQLATDAVAAADAGSLGPVRTSHSAVPFLLSKSTFQLSFGLQPTPDMRGLQFPLILAVRPEIWLTVPPGIEEAEVRRLATPAPKQAGR